MAEIYEIKNILTKINNTLQNLIDVSIENDNKICNHLVDIYHRLQD